MTFGDNYHHFSHIEPFAPKTPYALLPYCYGAGQQDGSGYSLAKEGWTRHQINGPVPLKGADGVVRSTSDNSVAGTNHSSLFRPIGLTFAPLMPVCAR